MPLKTINNCITIGSKFTMIFNKMCLVAQLCPDPLRELLVLPKSLAGLREENGREARKKENEMEKRGRAE